jgi:hypothetical protein
VQRRFNFKWLTVFKVKAQTAREGKDRIYGLNIAPPQPPEMIDLFWFNVCHPDGICRQQKHGQTKKKPKIKP